MLSQGEHDRNADGGFGRGGESPRMTSGEILCALQGLLPSLKTTAARLDLNQPAYWFEQTDAEATGFVRVSPATPP